MSDHHIEFDEMAHRYTVDGRVVPSVTQILNMVDREQFAYVSHDVLEAARELGSHVHRACHLFNRGELDYSSLDPHLLPYVEAWQQFLKDKSATVIASETRLYDSQLRICGTLDNLIQVRQHEWLTDLKTGSTVPRSVGPQTAAYERMLGRKYRRYCVHLTPGSDPPYKLIPLTSARDLPIFVSAYNIYKWISKDGL